MRLRQWLCRLWYGVHWDGEDIVHPKYGRYKAVVEFRHGMTLYPYQTAIYVVGIFHVEDESA